MWRCFRQFAAVLVIPVAHVSSHNKGLGGAPNPPIVAAVRHAGAAMGSGFLELDPSEIQPIDDGIRELRALMAVRDAAVTRLCATIFENGERAQDRLAMITRTHGVDTAVAALEDRTLMGRLSVGFLRGGFFRPTARQQALDAIPELVEALRDIEALRNRLGDLSLARIRLLNNVDHKRLAEFRLARKHEIRRSRSRPKG